MRLGRKGLAPFSGKRKLIGKFHNVLRIIQILISLLCKALVHEPETPKKTTKNKDNTFFSRLLGIGLNAEGDFYILVIFMTWIFLICFCCLAGYVSC